MAASLFPRLTRVRALANAVPVCPANPARTAFARQVAKIDLPQSDYTGIGLTSGLGHSVDEAAGSRAGCAGIKDTPEHPAPPLGSIH